MKRTNANEALNSLASMTGWGDLEQNEQTAITGATTKAAKALEDVHNAKLSAGEHLSKVEEILKPRRLFTVYLNEVFHMSRATGYRYINLFKALKDALPEPILKVAMLRSDDRLNIALVKSGVVAPRTRNVVKINEFLDSVQSGGPRLVQQRTPREIEKAMFHSASLLLRKVSGRSKTAVLNSTVGMLLTELGISNPMSFEPVAIPDNFLVSRGRPRKVA